MAPSRFIIRERQMQAFESQRRQGFEARLDAHLAQRFPERLAQLGAEEFQTLGRQGVARALEFGITAEADTVRFTELWVQLGPDFHSHPGNEWMAELLEQRQMPGELKVRRLVAGLAPSQEPGAGGNT
jgi:hypothetical protein